jgi:hypothetical protein
VKFKEFNIKNMNVFDFWGIFVTDASSFPLKLRNICTNVAKCHNLR